jgi:hypothetical protein
VFYYYEVYEMLAVVEHVGRCFQLVIALTESPAAVHVTLLTALHKLDARVFTAVVAKQSKLIVLLLLCTATVLH